MRNYGLRSATDLHETVHLLESWRNELFVVRKKRPCNAGDVLPALLPPDPNQAVRDEKQQITRSVLKFITAYQPRIPDSFRKKTERKMIQVLDKALFDGNVSLNDLYIAGLKTELILIKDARLAQRIQVLLFSLAVLSPSVIISYL